MNVLYPIQRTQPKLLFGLVFTRLYPHIPTLSTRDKTSTDGAFVQALLAPTFVNITKFDKSQTRAIQPPSFDTPTQTRHSFSGSGLTAAACQSKLALVVSMRIRNTGESLSRPFPRLQRTRRCRGRTSHSDVKRRTSKCTPSPWRTASRLPPLLPAATPVSNAPTCWRFPSSRIHRHRDTPVTTSTPPVTPSLDVPSVSILLRRGLPTSLAPVRTAQAQSPRGAPLAARPSDFRATAQSVCASIGKRLTRTPWAGILLTTVPSAATPAICSTSHPSPSPPQSTPQ